MILLAFTALSPLFNGAYLLTIKNLFNIYLTWYLNGLYGLPCPLYYKLISMVYHYYLHYAI